MENIFKYAKKELSQDAVITCILQEKDANAKAFIKSMLGTDCPSDFGIVSVSNQEYRIDVFVEIKVTDENGEHLEAIIIEDKTNTFLHDDQLNKYIDAAEKSGKKNVKKYNNVYFVLFKTGDYYFWERDMYAEMQEVYKDNPDVFFKTYLLADFKKFIKLVTLGYGWFKDFKDYINSKSPSTGWATSLASSSATFTDYITDKKWSFTDYKFGKADGSGDKGYELWLQGAHGSYDPITGTGGPLSAKNCYYLMPIICLQAPDNHFVIKFNLHLNLNPKNPHGYLPLADCEKLIGKTEMEKYRKLQDEIIKDHRKVFEKNGYKVNGRPNRLQIFSCKMEEDYTVNYTAAIDELKSKLVFLIDKVNEIKNDIDSGTKYTWL